MMRLYSTFLCFILALGLHAQNARVQVIHNSPTPGTEAGPVVDIYVNDGLLSELTAVPFRAATPYLDVPAGVDINVAVAVNPSSSSADAIATFNLGQLTDGGTFTLIANGIVGDATNPFNIEVNPAAREGAMMMGNVEFQVFHGSPDAPAVDVDAKGVGNLIENLPFGSFANDYSSVPPARYLLDIRANGSTDVVATFDANLSGLANGAATVFASGFLGNTPAFGLFAALPDGTVVEFPAFTPSLVINEVDYDQDGTDMDEFIELKNTGDASIPLVGTQLVLINGNGNTEYDRIDLPNVELGAGEYYVICFGDNAADYCDLDGGNSIQNGGPDGDAITLEFSGNIIDALSYEGSVDGAVEGSGEGLEDLDDVTPGSLARVPDGADTDQNNVDFAFQCATPGATNDGTDISCYPTTRLQVIHNSPTPGTESGPTVDIYVNGGLLPELTGVPFRAATPFLDVPALLDLSIAVAVSPSNSVDDAIATFDVGALAVNDTYVVIANGIVGNADTPFNLEINANAQEAAETGGNVEFAAFHGSPDAPNVDIDARGVGNLIPDLAFGSFTTDYLSVAPGVFYLDVRPAGAPTIVATFEADLSGLANGAATVFASGLLGDTPGFGLFAALPDGTVVEFPAVATLQLIHNSPSPTVDIYVNDDLYEDDFAFRTATEFRFVPTGVGLDIAVAGGDSGSSADAIATFPGVTLETGRSYVVIANGVVGDADKPFNLEINDMGREAAANPANVEFAAFHGSPDAPAVDIDARKIGNLVDGLDYAAFTDYLSVPPALYYLDIKADGDDAIVATFEADLSTLTGGAATVFASGFLAPGAEQPAFGVFAALADGTVVELPAASIACLQLIHNSPSPTVDIYVNDELYENDFAFRTATEFRFVPAGVDLNIAVAGENSSSSADAIATFPGVNLENGRDYVVIANGIVGDADTPFNLEINDNARSLGSNPNAVDFNVFHGSPDAPNVDVDVRLVGNVIGDLAFTEFSDYLTVPPGVFFVDVRAAGDPNIVGTFQADLTTLAGGAATVFASGFLAPGADQPAFGLFATLADGTIIELPAQPVARLQLIHNSPTPTVDIYVNGTLFEDNFAFRTATEFRFVPAGVELDIAVAGEDSQSAADAIATFDDVVLDNGGTYVIVANGIVGNGETPFDLVINAMGKEFSDDPEQFEISAFHGSPGAPNVDIADVFEGPVVQDLAFGAFSDYVALVPDLYGLEVSPTGSSDIVGTFLQDLSQLAGQAAVVFASGFVDPADGPQFNLFAALADGTVVDFVPIATLQTIHNAPGIAGQNVDLYAIFNGVSALGLASDVAFQEATNFIFLPTRLSTTIGVAPANSGGPNDIFAVLDNEFVLTDGRDHVGLASGTGTPEFPFEFFVRNDAKRFAENIDQVEVAITHGSPGAPAVDISEIAAGELIPGLAYGQFTDYLSLPLENYFFEVRPEDNPALVGTFNLDLSAFTGAEGLAATVFASGIVGDENTPFDLLVAFPSGEVFPLTPVAGVQIIHNSPSPTVDIYANDELIEDDLTYLDATPYQYFPSRVSIDLDVAGEDSGSSADAIASFDGIVLSEDRAYVIVANGVVGNDDTPFNLSIFDQARQRSFSSGVDLLFFHGSPDAPEVDITADGVGVLFDNVSFGNFSTGYQNVPTDNYVVNVTPSNDNDDILASYSAPLTDLNAEGSSITIFASGFLTPGSTPGFEPCAALADGTVLCLVVGVEELEDKVEGFGVQPNPVRTQAEVQFTISEALDITINIFDGTGRLISTEYLGQQAAGIYNRTLDVSALPAGVYNYSLVTSKGILSRKFVVVK